MQKKAKPKNVNYFKSIDLVQVRGTIIRRDPLSETKRKIIALEASKVRDSDTAETVYEMTAKEVLDLCSLTDGGENYKQFFSEIYELSGKSIAFINENNLVSIESYMVNIQIDRLACLATYTIPKMLLPHFKLYGQFAKMSLIEYMPMRSGYALLLYELLMSWRKRGEVKYTLPDIRRLLEVPDGAYPITADLLRCVVYTALENINDRIQGEKIKYELVYGRRRKVEAIKFIIPQPSEQIPEPILIAGPQPIPTEPIPIPIPIESKPIPKIEPEMQEFVRMLGPDQATVALDKYGRDYCLANLDYAKSHAKSPRYIGYLRKALADNYANHLGMPTAAVTKSVKSAFDPNCIKCEGRGIYHDPNSSSGFSACGCDKK